jgi:hypothetical protein
MMNQQQQQHLAPYENLVTQYEAASNHLPANLAARFQDSVYPGSQQMALLIEQWISAEGVFSGGGSHQSPFGAGGRRSSKILNNNKEVGEQQNESAYSSPSPQRSSFPGSSSSPVGLSNAAKGRLRNLIEQGLTSFVQRLQSTVMSEIETVTIASAQVAARGGILNHQYESLQTELGIARKEITRIHEAARVQADEMKILREESQLREQQFDLVRQQLISREEMLKEATTTFRKELARFRSRIADLEAELERRHLTANASVVGHFGFRSASSNNNNNTNITNNNNNNHPLSPLSKTNNNNNNNTMIMTGTLRPHQSPQQQQSTSTNNNNNNRVPAEPDARGVLAVAAMDHVGSPTTTTHNFDNFSFVGGGNGDDNNNNDNNNNTSGHHHPSPSPTRLITMMNMTNYFSPSSKQQISQLVQVASETGMEEALKEMRKEFEQKLFAAKERFAQDKRDSIAQVKTKQDLMIRQLKRENEEKDRELEKLREKINNQ